MKKIKYYLASVLSELYYPFFKKKSYNILSLVETIEYMSKPGNCIVRFGDGEFMMMSEKNICFQEYDMTLSSMLYDTIKDLDSDNLLICLPEPLKNLKTIKKGSKRVWKLNFFLNRKIYLRCLNSQYHYGNAFVSRPYMAYKSNEQANYAFTKILELFKEKNILIVEGKLSRSGVGNDLFSSANTLSRIICPSSNAFIIYDRIVEAVMKYGKNKLILVALGPTAKPLIRELSKQGYWALDIGHLDSEYEWYLSGTRTKMRNNYKHSAECSDELVEPCFDKKYIDSIVCDLTN